MESLLIFLRASLLPAAVILLAGMLVIHMVKRVLTSMLEKTKLEKAAHSLILSVASICMYIVLGLMVAAKLGIDVTSLVALASVLTLAVSLAVQNMLANVFGGFTLLSTVPFHSGDYVEIAGQAGTVEEINMTYTKLTTPDNKLISIPNSSVVAAQIVNYSAAETRRVAVDVTVPYDVPTQKVLDALVLAGTVDNVLLDPAPAAVITGYGESAMNYSLRIWVKNEDYWDVFFLVNQRLKTIFDEQQIPLACPKIRVQMEN